MKEKIINRLVCVKSIMTLLTTGVFCYLSIIGKISAELFMTTFTIIVGFYFGTQNEKKNIQTIEKTE